MSPTTIKGLFLSLVVSVNFAYAEGERAPATQEQKQIYSKSVKAIDEEGTYLFGIMQSVSFNFVKEIGDDFFLYENDQYPTIEENEKYIRIVAKDVDWQDGDSLMTKYESVTYCQWRRNGALHFWHPVVSYDFIFSDRGNLESVDRVSADPLNCVNLDLPEEETLLQKLERKAAEILDAKAEEQMTLYYKQDVQFQQNTPELGQAISNENKVSFPNSNYCALKFENVSAGGHRTPENSPVSWANIVKIDIIFDVNPEDPRGYDSYEVVEKDTDDSSCEHLDQLDYIFN